MAGVDLALAVLPGWVGPATVIAPVALALLAGWGVATILAFVGGRRRRLLRPDSHWTERAAAIWPARVGLGLATIFAPVGVAALAVAHGGELSPLPLGLRVVLAATAAAVGALLAARPVRGWLGFAPTPAGERARAALVLGVVRWGVVALVALAALLIPVDALLFRIVATLVLCVLPVLSLAGLPLDALAAVGLAEPADDRVRRLAAEAAGQGPPPRLYVVPGELPNAFAFPLGNRVMIPRPTLALLDDDELRAVLAHEIAHLREPVPVRLSRLAGAWTLVAIVWLRPAFTAAEGDQQLWVVGGMVGVLFVLGLLRRIAGRMEVRADAHGQAAHGGAEGAYASALEKIYRAGMIPAVLPRRGVHPPLYDRLVAAGARPDWPRPAAPSLAAVYATFVVVAVALGCSGGLGPAFLAPVASPAVAHARIALGAGTSRELAALSDEALTDAATPAGPDVPRALGLLAAAAALDPHEVRWPSRLASLYASTGDCLGAVRALRSASATQASVGAWVGDHADEGFELEPPPPEYQDATEAVSRCLGTPAWGVDQGAPGVPPG